MNPIGSQSFQLSNEAGDTIRGDVHLPERTKDAPVVILCHGFKGFKDWGFFPVATERLAREGWCAIRFNFSHNGIGEDFFNYTEPDRFAKNTLSKELTDLDCVITSVCNRAFLPAEIDVRKLALIGHSRGGGIAAIQAASDARVTSLVLWAAVATFDRWGEATKRTWRDHGSISVLNTRTRQRMRLDRSLLEDYERNHERFDIENAVHTLSKPLLIVHGDQDVTVSAKEAHRLYAASNASITAIEIIPHTDHAFGVSHPYGGMTLAFRKVLQRTLFWLRVNTKP